VARGLGLGSMPAKSQNTREKRSRKKNYTVLVKPTTTSMQPAH